MNNTIDYIQFKSIETFQPIGPFYIGAIDSKDLLSISYADVRRIEKRDVEKYLGIQRPLSPDRVKELEQYVNLIDATFPTSVILSVSSENVEYNPSTLTMKIKKMENIAKIIDGQHRLAGLEKYKGNKFEVNVVIFLDMDIEDQAMVFSTINLKQTKVNKSLAYDLYELAKSRSPQKTCHNIAKLLDSKEESPFFKRIKILGRAESEQGRTITQATFVESLIGYISADPMKDRDLLKRGVKIAKCSVVDSKKYIFRNLFVENKDAIIANVIWNYFSAIKTRWENAWVEVQRGNILNKSTGFKSFMKFLPFAYLSLGKESEKITSSDFINIFKKINLNDTDFNIDRYKPGAIGEGDLYKDLLARSGLK